MQTNDGTKTSEGFAYGAYVNPFKKVAGTIFVRGKRILERVDSDI